jgi:hypothetical protein
MINNLLLLLHSWQVAQDCLERFKGKLGHDIGGS